MELALPDIAAVGPLQIRIIAETALAMLLGGAIGYEREQARKPAGLRTHMLVAGTAALLVGLGEPLVASFAEIEYGDQVRPDPFRLIEALVTGIAIVGAGTIFRRTEDHVEGLTTAASLLFVGVIGVAVAIGHLAVAVAAAVLVLVALRVLTAFERRAKARSRGDGKDGP